MKVRPGRRPVTARGLLPFLCLLALAGCPAERPDVPDRDAPEAPADPEPPHAVAVTIDDLPTIGTRTLAEAEAVTDGLLRHLREADVPAVGFVNEVQLAAGRETRTRLLERWLEAGMELGNHTHAHTSLHRTPLAEFQEEVLRGERVTRPLMEERGMELRWFRHPYLHTGREMETRARLEAFLDEHGYEAAPVTVDSDDWVFAAAYRVALDAGDEALMERIVRAYITHVEETFDYFERLSRELVDRIPAQVLLLHANPLNADHLDRLLEVIDARGYRFVPLEEALTDPVYDLPDRYTGPRGISWLKRWAITRGLEPPERPQPPDWVEEVRRR